MQGLLQWTFNQHLFKNSFWVLLIPLILYTDLQAGRDYRTIYCLDIICSFDFTLFNEKLNKMPKNKFLSIVGGMCYSIYLIHYIFISFVGNKILSMLRGFIDVFILQYAIYFVTVSIAILLGSAIFFVFFEKPFIYKDWYKNVKGS